jgi:Spy/CpxP family protein refolding chaperone
MTLPLRKIATIPASLLLAATIAGGLAAAQSEARADEHHGGHGEMQGHGGHGGEAHCPSRGKGKGKGGGHKGRHGAGMEGKHGKDGHGGHLFGEDWRNMLTAEQKLQLDRLHVEFAKTKVQLKAQIKALKLQLAVLATSEQPQPAAIDAGIEEVLAVKRQLMSAKYGYIAAQRRVLTPEQQVSFDLEVLKRAKHGKRDQHHGKGGDKH